MKYVFDKETGTWIEQVQEQQETAAPEPMAKPEGKQENNIARKEQLNVEPDEDDDEGQIIFKKFSDLSIKRVDDEATGEWICYFAGYALDIQFNIDYIKRGNSANKIEACLDGITQLFRSIITEQVLR